MSDARPTCPRCKAKLSRGSAARGRCPVCGFDMLAGAARGGKPFADALLAALPSKTLAGYVIEDVLSSGRRRAVLKGRSTEDPDRLVAIKAVAHDRASPTVQETLIERARLAVGVRHESLATLLDVGAGPGLGVAYFVCEFVPGEDLAKSLERGGTLTPADAAAVGLALARALQALHEAGAVHMDVKPAHIVVEAGAARLVETGFAPVLLSSFRHGETALAPIVGTPTYVAPEQAKDVTAATPASDLYSLGAAMFHLVAGRPPFIGDSAVGILVQHAARPAPPVKSLAPAAPDELARVIDSLLAKASGKRPTAAQVASALTPLCGAPPPAAERGEPETAPGEPAGPEEPAPAAREPSARACRPLSRTWLAREVTLAEILVELGAAAREDIQAVLSPRDYSPEAGRSLAETLVGLGRLAREDAGECEKEFALRMKRREDAAFARLAIEMGYAAREDLDGLLAETDASTSGGETAGVDISEAAVRAGVLTRRQAAIVEAACLRYLCELDSAAQQRTARKCGVVAEAVTAAREALAETPARQDRSLFEILVEQGAITPAAAWALAAEHVRQDLGIE